jgi:hypothetical protein
MKIYAKQVPPEYQDSNFEPECWPGIIFHGNRQFISHTTPEFDAIYDRFDGEKRILRALHLVTGERYDVRTIRGCCQSDWQTIYYPVEEYTRDALDILEADYFNTGTEWIVDVDGCDVGVYTYSWNNDGTREEIADAVGVDPADVVLLEFTGWNRTAAYTEVTA